MRLDVDEPRRHHQPARVDVARRARPGEQARWRDAGDAVAFDGDVAVIPGTTRAVHHPAALDHHVVRAGGRRGRGDPGRVRAPADEQDQGQHAMQVHGYRPAWRVGGGVDRLNSPTSRTSTEATLPSSSTLKVR